MRFNIIKLQVSFFFNYLSNYLFNLGHPLVLKLGTITPDGGGDVYCYACDNGVVDEDLPHHLSHFGIQCSEQSQTVKNTAELELDLNKNMNWSSVYDTDGSELKLKYGAGFCGFGNIGNSCYLNSVLQILFIDLCISKLLGSPNQGWFFLAPSHLTMPLSSP